MGFNPFTHANAASWILSQCFSGRVQNRLRILWGQREALPMTSWISSHASLSRRLEAIFGQSDLAYKPGSTPITKMVDGDPSATSRLNFYSHIRCIIKKGITQGHIPYKRIIVHDNLQPTESHKCISGPKINSTKLHRMNGTVTVYFVPFVKYIYHSQMARNCLGSMEAWQCV
jgi:hypothetical protein